MTTPYNGELTVLVNCLASTFGDEVGQAVQDKFDQIFALEAADINAISAQIAQLNALLASNTSGDVLTAQSILAQLAALDNRIDVLEGSTAVSDLSIVVTALQAALAGEIASRADADAALQSSINTIQSALDTLTSQVVSIVNEGTGGGPACDCVALTAAIADQATAIANLQATDASTAVQIAALQAAVAGLATSGAAVAAAQAAADAAQATAQTALAAASAAAATAAGAATAAAGAQTTADAALAAATGADGDITNLLVEIKNINCASHGHTFRTAMRGRMFAVGDSRRD